MLQTLQKLKLQLTPWRKAPQGKQSPRPSVLFGLNQPTASLMSVILVFGSLLLSGCQAPSRNETVIRLSTWGSAHEISVLKSLLDEFEQTHPTIHVELMHIPDNYYQKLHILIAGDLAPDVIFTNSINFPIYATQGVFLDLTPYLQASKKLSAQAFYPAALKAFQWKNPNDTPKQAMLGAIPRDISNLVVFYNQNLFRKAGQDFPKADWNWQDFTQTAQALTLDANHDGDPEQFGFSFYAQPPLFWLPFVWSAGGELFSPDLKQFSLSQPKAVEGLQFYADLRNKWHVAPKKVESGGATMSQLFLQQKVAMMVSGRWSVPVLREQAKFQWDVVPFPIGPSGKSRVGIDASGYAISTKAPHPDACWELIQFLVSRPAIEKVTASGLIVPARPDVAESHIFLEPTQAPINGRAFLDVIPDGVPTHTPPRWNELSETLQLALEPVWNGKQTAQQATTAIQPQLQRMLEVGP